MIEQQTISIWNAQDYLDELEHFQTKPVCSPAIADLNHTVINASLNISAIVENETVQNEVAKIINAVKKFSKQ